MIEYNYQDTRNIKCKIQEVPYVKSNSNSINKENPIIVIKDNDAVGTIMHASENKHFHNIPVSLDMNIITSRNDVCGSPESGIESDHPVSPISNILAASSCNKMPLVGQSRLSKDRPTECHYQNGDQENAISSPFNCNVDLLLRKELTNSQDKDIIALARELINKKVNSAMTDELSNLYESPVINNKSTLNKGIVPPESKTKRSPTNDSECTNNSSIESSITPLNFKPSDLETSECHKINTPDKKNNILEQDKLNEIFTQNKPIKGSKRLYLRRIRSLNGDLKRVLILETDFGVVANERFLKDREKIMFAPIIFSNDQPPRLPHKKRYFFSLPNLSQVTKLKRRRLSDFCCNFDDEDDTDSNDVDIETVSSATSIETVGERTETQNSTFILDQVPIKNKTNDESITKATDKAICKPPNSHISCKDDWQSFDLENGDAFYASDWDPETNHEMETAHCYEEINEVILSEHESTSSEVENTLFSEPISKKSPEKKVKRTTGLSRLEKLKLDLKKREDELEKVRRRRGCIQ